MFGFLGALYPIERIQKVCGSDAKKALKLYKKFLKQISDEDIRKELDGANSDDNGMKCVIFRDLKNESKHFSWLLSTLLKKTYDESHPIHHAVMF